MYTILDDVYTVGYIILCAYKLSLFSFRHVADHRIMWALSESAITILYVSENNVSLFIFVITSSDVI